MLVILWSFYILMAIRNILWSFGICRYVVVIWYISPRLGMFYQEKSGNPGGK
jgi:hypothetical protein